MRLFIFARGISLTKEVRSYVERRLHFASDRFADQIGDVTVVLRDLNGPRGGVDKECIIRVESPRIGSLVVEERSEGVMAAIFGAVQRFSDTMKKRIARRNKHSRLPLRSVPTWRPVHDP